MAYENRKLIKQLNQIPFVGLKNIKVGDVLSVATWGFKNWTNEFIKCINIYTVRGFNFEVIGENPKIVFVFSHNQLNRIDQLIKFQAVTALFDNRVDIIAKQEGGAINPFLAYIPIWYVQMRHLNYSSTVKRGICYKLCETMGYVNEIEMLIRKTPGIEKIACFFDVSAVDSLLVQKYNQRNFTTYTLQHGIVNGSYDYIEYKCSHAKYMLAWGEYTKRMAMRCGVSEEKIKIVGNVSHLLESDISLQETSKKTGCFAVCTNGVLTKKDWSRNKELISMANRIAEKYKMKYFLKIHPCDDVTKYKYLINSEFCIEFVNKGTDIIEVLRRVDFTLCGNSTTFCDSIYYSVPSFRYIHDYDKKKDVCRGIKFGRVKSYDELVEKIESLREEPSDYEIEMKKVRAFLYDMGDVAHKYKAAIMDDQ